MEATVTINGKSLSPAEVMTIRVALNGFIEHIQKPDSLGSDDHGKAMQAGYIRCANATLDKLVAE